MLRIYAVVLEVLKELQPVLRRIELKDRDLARQLRRCSCSVALNLSEGMYSRGRESQPALSLGAWLRAGDARLSGGRRDLQLCGGGRAVERPARPHRRHAGEAGREIAALPGWRRTPSGRAHLSLPVRLRMRSQTPLGHTPIRLPRPAPRERPEMALASPTASGHLRAGSACRRQRPS
jgi:hypothetical protein